MKPIFNYVCFQVAIVALNVYGNEVEDNNNSVSPDGDGGSVPSKGAASIPLSEDLAFAMYVDSTVVETIKKLDDKIIPAKQGDFIAVLL